MTIPEVDKWRDRAKALERALVENNGLCTSCTNYEVVVEDEPCYSCEDHCHWEFNEAKYSEGAE